MARKIFGSEAVPKIFQTFNSLLGGIVRKRNATIVRPSKQLVGEFPEVDFERLYQYYHHWDQIKTAVDVMHQKFRGSGIKIKSNNEYFNTFIEKWWDSSNSEKKWSQFIFSLLITGSAIMELQYTDDGTDRLGNVEQIPMQTIYRLFRDQFGNELKIVQIVDGVFKELDPQYFIHSTINNPDRQAFGKSMFHTLASPRPITGTVDPFTGEAINSARQSMPLLDAQAELQNAEIEIKKKMAKPRMLVSATGMPREQMDQIQAEMADENSSQYIWIFDKPVQSAELQVQAQGKFDEYGTNVDAHIDVGTIFASNVIKNPQGFSYSGSQTPFDVLDQRMADLQSELIETIKDRLLKPLAESWNFKDFEAMEVEISFTPTMKRLTMEDIRGLDPEAVSKKEIREMYKALNIPLDDKLWDEEQKELKQDKQDQKNIQMQDAMVADVAGGGEGDDPAGGDEPFKTDTGDDDKPKPAGGAVKAPSVKSAGTQREKSPFDMDRPKPTPDVGSRPKDGENLHNRLIKQLANENLSPSAMIEAIKAIERIPMPPRAGSDGTSGSDLYVSQGIDDQEDKPSITDPNVRMTYGLDKEDEDTPPTDPNKMAHAGDRPTLEGADNGAGRFTNSDNMGIPQTANAKPPMKSEDEYMQHLQASNNGEEIQGGTGNDGITPDSDGSFKDPMDLNNDLESTPETPQANANPHPRPNQEPMVNDPNDLTMSELTGGSDALPDNTNEQILGANDEDEQPIVPSEGFPEDNDEEKKKKLEDSQNLGEAVSPTMPEKIKTRAQPDPVADNRDIIEGEDPLTSGTSDDPTPELNQVRKPQAQLDDTPLNDPSANKGNINGIDPNMIDAEQTNTTDAIPLANDGMPEEASKFEDPEIDTTYNNLGDSNQVRLQDEEQTGLPQDPLLPNDGVLDNTGLNVEPELGYTQVSEDDYNKKVQDGSNPLEQEGEPLIDGMIMSPDDVQQNGGIGDTDGLGVAPPTPDGTTALDTDPNTVNDPTDSGIEEEQVDPNILHPDPENPDKLITDLTDEQGEPVPDLRFDQTPTSDEEQPNVELEYEIVTQEDFDAHTDASKGQAPNPMGLDPALQDPMGAITDETPMEDPLDPTETDELGNPMELGDNNAGLEDPLVQPLETSDTTSETPDINDDNSGIDEEPETSQNSDSQNSETPKKSGGDKETSKPKPKESDDSLTKDIPEEGEEPKEKSTKSDDSDKSQDSEDSDSKDGDSDSKDEETPKRKGTVKDIIKREHELLDKDIDEEEVHKILEDEFGEDRIEKAEETKTWKNRR